MPDDLVSDIFIDAIRLMMGVIAVVFTLLYIINPFDFFPGPIDDIIVFILGAFVAKWGFDIPGLM